MRVSSSRPDERYVCFVANAEKDAPAEQVLEFAEAAVRILAATVRTTLADVRAFRPVRYRPAAAG